MRGVSSIEDLPILRRPYSVLPWINPLPSSRPAINWLVAVLLILIPGVLRAQLPGCRLDTLFPPGGRLGTTVEVLASGGDLDDPVRLWFSHPGIQSSPPRSPGEARFGVTLSSNVPPGLYEARIEGRFGVSNPRLFQVGDLPELLEPATNLSFQAAHPIQVGATVNGQVSAGRSDYYRFPARQGDRLMIECEAEGLDSKLEPVLWLHSQDRREKARSRQGGFMDFTVPSDGVYVLRLHDHLNRGGNDYFYRLTVSTRPRLEFAVPASGLPGTNRPFTLIGRNLPGGKSFGERGRDGKPLEHLTVHLDVPEAGSGAPRLRAGMRLPPEAASLDGFTYELPSTQGVSNPLFISVASVPTVAEIESSSNQVQIITPPVDVSGRFHRSGDLDRFEFEARKGQIWIIEVISQRLGSSSDPALHVQRISRDGKGAEQASDAGEAHDAEALVPGNDYRTASGDPAYRLEVKEDGLHRVLVRDQSAASMEDPTAAYRMVVRPPQPDFRLLATPVFVPPANKDSKAMRLPVPALRAGATIPLRVMVFRRDGFDAPIDLRVEGLPKGVRTPGARVAGDARSALILLTADEVPTNALCDIRVIGKATTSAGERTREARVGGMIWGVENYEQELVRSRMGDQLMVSLIAPEPCPLTLEFATTNAVEAPVGGKLQLPVNLRHRADFPNNPKLRLVGHPALGAGKELDVDKKATNGVFELDLAQLKLPEGEHWLHVETQVTFQALRSVEAHRQAESAKAEAEKQIPTLKDLQDKAKASLAESTKAVEQLEAQTKTQPDQAPALAKAREAKAGADSLLADATRRLDETTRAKTVAEERIKQFAKRDFTDTFYSPPLLVRVLPAKKN